jgi:hypothetical protein
MKITISGARAWPVPRNLVEGLRAAPEAARPRGLVSSSSARRDGGHGDHGPASRAPPGTRRRLPLRAPAAGHGAGRRVELILPAATAGSQRGRRKRRSTAKTAAGAAPSARQGRPASQIVRLLVRRDNQTATPPASTVHAAATTSTANVASAPAQSRPPPARARNRRRAPAAAIPSAIKTIPRVMITVFATCALRARPSRTTGTLPVARTTPVLARCSPVRKERRGRRRLYLVRRGLP